MTVPVAAGYVTIGILLLYVGGEALVRGAVGMARLARVSTAVIGLTVVSIGTSLPELAVSLVAAISGSPDVGTGNVVGSNIFNVGMIAGISVVIMPIAVRSETIKLEWPFMFVTSVIVLLLARDLVLDRLEGGFFVVTLIVFLTLIVRSAMAEAAASARGQSERRARRAVLYVVLVVVGIVLLTFGAQLLVKGAVRLAELAGVSQRVIGLTVVAMGTSLPELAAVIVAASRKEGDLALGNVIGSNIFNLLAILGTVSLVKPLPINETLVGGDMWWMIGFSFLLFPMMFTRLRISRLEGAILLMVFFTYIVLVLL